MEPHTACCLFDWVQLSRERADFHSFVTRACRSAVRPPRTSLTQRASAAGTSAGSLTSSEWAPNASPILAKWTFGASSASKELVVLASPSGNTRSVDCLTAFQPELSITMDNIGSLYCCETASTEGGLPK